MVSERQVWITRVVKRLETQVRVAHQSLAHDIRTVVQMRVQLLLRVSEKPGLAALIIIAMGKLPQDLDAVQVVKDAEVGPVPAASRWRELDGVCGSINLVKLRLVDAKRPV